MSFTGTCRTQHRTLVPRSAVAKALPPASPTGDEFFVVSVLSLPLPDLAGDIVHADRFTFNAHRADPIVDFEHGRHPEIGKRPVGMALDSIRPRGSYAVYKCRLNVPGVGPRDLPVGGTYFDRDDALQRQVCFGVRDGQWPGVSLEFVPNWSVAKSLGRSPLEARDAYDFPAADVVRWTHCVEPVCPGASSVLKAVRLKSLPPELDALARTLRDGTIRGERLHPAILKSLARYQPTTVLAQVGKAMPAAPMPADSGATAYDPAMPDEAQPDQQGPPLNGVTAIYAHVEALLAAAQQLEQDMQSSDSPELRSFATTFKSELEALATKAKSTADQHDAKLNGYMPLADDTPLVDDTADADPMDDLDDADEVTEPSDLDGDDAEMEGGEDEGDDEKPAKKKKAPPFEKALHRMGDLSLDADGGLVHVRSVYPVVLKARRAAPQYTLDEIAKGIESARAAWVAPAPVEQPEDPALAKAALSLAKQMALSKRERAIHS